MFRDSFLPWEQALYEAHEYSKEFYTGSMADLFEMADPKNRNKYAFVRDSVGLKLALVLNGGYFLSRGLNCDSAWVVAIPRLATVQNAVVAFVRGDPLAKEADKMLKKKTYAKETKHELYIF